MFLQRIGKLLLGDIGNGMKPSVICPKINVYSTEANAEKKERVFARSTECDSEGFPVFDRYMNKIGRGFMIGKLKIDVNRFVTPHRFFQMLILFLFLLFFAVDRENPKWKRTFLHEPKICQWIRTGRMRGPLTPCLSSRPCHCRYARVS